MQYNLIETHVVYYIGGPADLRKEAKFGHPQREIIIREAVRPLPNHGNGRIAIAEFLDHRYLVRQIGKNTYVAIHDTLV